MAELFVRRTGLPAEDRLDWWIDPEAAVTAEIDGVEEELFLTKHRLTRTAEITKESAISGSFNALVNEVIRVSVEVDEDLFE